MLHSDLQSLPPVVVFLEVACKYGHSFTLPLADFFLLLLIWSIFGSDKRCYHLQIVRGDISPHLRVGRDEFVLNQKELPGMEDRGKGQSILHYSVEVIKCAELFEALLEFQQLPDLVCAELERRCLVGLVVQIFLLAELLIQE